MPGIVIVQSGNSEIARVRYKSKNERKSILSFINLLYDLKGYTIIISPDDSTEDQIQAQCLQAGCYYGYMRAAGIHDDDSYADSVMVHQKVI
jgi:hypothetical protein